MANEAQANVEKQKSKVSKCVRSRASSPPCAACKKMRKKCSSDCIFAPYFGSSQGSTLFAAVHKVFGANNLSKLLLEVEEIHRNETINSLCYEAQTRLANPVHGCVSTISALQRQVSLIITMFKLLPLFFFVYIFTINFDILFMFIAKKKLFL